MYLGIDLGTSGVKAVLADDEQNIIAQGNGALDVSRPQPMWSEQDPETWWQAILTAVAEIKAEKPDELASVRGIGLSGQMHGATLLDGNDRILRPAILWNDGRSAAECTELEARVPDVRRITGNLVMPGFTAPKVQWVRNHEPEIYRQIAKVLLPKDYLRLRLTGDYISEMSDAAGTVWLDVAGRDWSDAMLEATGLDRSHMPSLVEGSRPGGTLRRELAAEWGMTGDVVVAGGAGDNAAGAAGIGTVAPGRAFLSLGTSGVYFVANRDFSPNPEQAVHAFCHCFPDTWHQMTVILSAASCLSWVTELARAENEAALVAEVEAAGDTPGSVFFLPYLSGERTPHNNPNAKGVFFGMSPDTGRVELARAVLEGVAFAFADGQDALLAAGAEIDIISVIGGGSRSPFWGRVLASVLGRQLTYHTSGEVGPAFGAARLGRLAATGENPIDVCTLPPVDHTVDPDPALNEIYLEKIGKFRRLYAALKGEFAKT